MKHKLDFVPVTGKYNTDQSQVAYTGESRLYKINDYSFILTEQLINSPHPRGADDTVPSTTEKNGNAVVR